MNLRKAITGSLAFTVRKYNKLPIDTRSPTARWLTEQSHTPKCHPVFHSSSQSHYYNGNARSFKLDIDGFPASVQVDPCEMYPDLNKEHLKKLEEKIIEHPCYEMLKKMIPDGTVIVFSNQEVDVGGTAFSHKGIIAIPLESLNDADLTLKIIFHEAAHLYERFHFHDNADFHYKGLWGNEDDYVKEIEYVEELAKKREAGLERFFSYDRNGVFTFPIVSENLKDKNTEIFTEAVIKSPPVKKYGFYPRERFSTAVEEYSHICLIKNEALKTICDVWDKYSSQKVSNTDYALSIAITFEDLKRTYQNSVKDYFKNKKRSLTDDNSNDIIDDILILKQATEILQKSCYHPYFEAIEDILGIKGEFGLN